MAMEAEAEEEGRKGIPSLLSSGEENIASNITEVLKSLFPFSVQICRYVSLERRELLGDVDVCGFLFQSRLSFDI
jgi:hypothetical protein